MLFLLLHFFIIGSVPQSRTGLIKIPENNENEIFLY